MVGGFFPLCNLNTNARIEYQTQTTDFIDELVVYKRKLEDRFATLKNQYARIEYQTQTTDFIDELVVYKRKLEDRFATHKNLMMIKNNNCIDCPEV